MSRPYPASASVMCSLAIMGLAQGCVIVNVLPDDDDETTAVSGATGGDTKTATGADSDGGVVSSSSTGSDTGSAATSSTGSATTSAGSSTESSTTNTTSTGSDTESSTTTSLGSDTGSSTTTSLGSDTESPTTTSAASDASSSTTTDTDTDTGGAPSACANGLLEPPELCLGTPTNVESGAEMSPAGFVVADFTDDGSPDLAVLSRRTVNNTPELGQIDILEANPVDGLSNLTTHLIGNPANMHKGGAVRGTHGADYDQDGRVDLAFIDEYRWAVDSQPYLRLWLSQGDGTFVETFQHEYAYADFVISAAGEFTGDGLPDVVTAESDGLHVWAGLGNGQLAMPMAAMPPANVTSMRANYVDGDAISDLRVASAAGSVLLLGQPGGGFVELPPLPCSPGALAFDLDGDGFMDTLCGGLESITAYLGVGDGTFEPPVVTAYPPLLPVGGIVGTVTGDFDGDGVTDAALINQTMVYVARGLGDGSFEPPTLVLEDVGLPDPWWAGGLGFDFDGNGVDDVLRANSTVTTSFFLRLMLSEP